VHATAQARELGISRVLVPRTAPTFSALGLQLSDHLIDEVRSYISPAGQIDTPRLNRLFGEMESSARAMLGRRRGAHLRVELHRIMNLCYPGQTFDMAVPIAADGRLGDRDVADTVERFHAQHEELHTYASRDEEPILRSLRLTAVGVTEKPKLPTVGRASGALPRKGKRRAYFDGSFTEVPIYNGSAMRVGHKVRGPAIIEEPFTTIVLHPDQQATLDRYGNYHITV
jgi:N-methylhydantoinase A